MDLLECLTCELRFTIAHAGVAQSWSCPDCEETLALVAIGLPGTAEEVSTALNARYLLSLSRRRDGASGDQATLVRDPRAGPEVEGEP